MRPEDLIVKAAVIIVFLGVAFPIHEFAHALAAYRLGDGTAKLMGRLTLNPRAHFDPAGGLILAISVLLTSFAFGWAKPTPVNPSNFRDRRNGDVIVALAGPVSNLLMATLGAFVFRALDLAGVLLDLPRDVVFVLYYFVAFNVLLAIFNLLPVPPLDGSAILFRLLPAEYAWRLRPFLQQYGFILLIGLFIVGGNVLGDLIFNVTNVLVGAG